MITVKSFMNVLALHDIVQISQLLHQLQLSTPLARSQRPTEPYK